MITGNFKRVNQHTTLRVEGVLLSTVGVNLLGNFVEVLHELLEGHTADFFYEFGSGVVAHVTGGVGCEFGHFL